MHSPNSGPTRADIYFTESDLTKSRLADIAVASFTARPKISAKVAKKVPDARQLSESAAASAAEAAAGEAASATSAKT